MTTAVIWCCVFNLSGFMCVRCMYSAAYCWQRFYSTFTNLFYYCNVTVFTALHAMQWEFCPSVCLSITRVHCDKTV